MKNTAIQRIVLGMLALFLLSYTGYQVYRYLNAQVKTETVYPYTVTQTAKVTGIALREEIVLDAKIDGGVAAYIPADGAKLSAGSPIAEIYRSAQDADNIRRLRELKEQRALLERAQDPGTTYFAHTDVLNKQIFNELGSVIDAVNRQNLGGVQTASDNLLVLMNTKQIATGKQDNFDGTIERMQAEETYYAGKISADPSLITAPRPGYFVRSLDGFEGKVNIKQLNALYAEDLFELINSPASNISNDWVGKLMVGHNWYFAAQVPSTEIDQYKKGAQVSLDFHLNGVAPVPAVVSQVNMKQDDPSGVVVFLCDYINEPLINLRMAQADVQFKSITGLRVSNSAIRYIGIQRGVYTVLGEKLIFRPVEVIHEDVGFVLCREVQGEDPAFKNSLQQYDEVVIEGAQLYDNKQIKGS